jgi:predicted RNA-binding Zn ribbon-like protein
MPIVQAGKTFTKDDLKFTAGKLAADITDIVQACGDYQRQLQTWVDADLVAMGLTQDEINAQKGFFIGDLPTIQDTLLNSTWIRQLLGTGV